MLVALVLSLGMATGATGSAGQDLETVRTLLAQQRSGEALTTIEALQRRAPSSELALLRVRALLLQSQLEQARFSLAQMGHRYSSEVAVHLQRADVYTELGDIESGIAVLQTLKDRWPNNANVAERVGDAYARLAAAAYLDALLLDPEDQTTRLKFSGLAATERISSPREGQTLLPAGEELRATMAEITETLKIWADAWSASDMTEYAAAYVPPLPIELEQPNGSRRLVSEIAVVFTSPNRAQANFVELQRAGGMESKRFKRVNLSRGTDRRWRLSNERVLAP